MGLRTHFRRVLAAFYKTQIQIYVADGPGGEPRFSRIGTEKYGLGSGFNRLDIFVRNLDRIRPHDLQSYSWVSWEAKLLPWEPL